MRRKLQRLFLYHLVPGLALIYIGFGLVLWYFQTSFIYHPTAQDFTNCPALQSAEPISFGSTRGYYHAGGDTLVVLYHGNAGSACDRAWYARDFFLPLGLSFLIVEYTGFSNDNILPNAEHLYANVTDVTDWIKASDYSSVIVMGESIGGGPAARHNALLPPEELILSTPFYSLESTAAALYPLYPVRLLLREELNVAAELTSATNSIHIIHGDADTIIDVREAERLFASLATTEKTLTIIPGAGHNGVYLSPLWEETVFSVLRNYEEHE